MSLKAQKEAENEARILRKLNHTYIVKYLDSFSEAGFLNIITEYCKGGDLGQYIKR
jgi:NIMA (never in mitosis gene a)-related kinase 1/4/5